MGVGVIFCGLSDVFGMLEWIAHLNDRCNPRSRQGPLPRLKFRCWRTAICRLHRLFRRLFRRVYHCRRH